MKKLLVILTCLLLITTPAQAADYRKVSQAEMKKWLETSREMLIVDIRPAAAFSRQHFAGAMETNAFPVSSAAEKQRLDRAVQAFLQNPRDLVIICPLGRSGANKAYDYLKSMGVPEERLFILTGGMDGWPHKELVRSR